MDDEVAQIWPESWKSGKILFLLTEYSAILSTLFGFFIEYRIHSLLSTGECDAFHYIMNIFSIILSNSAEASLWLCLYALLGARAKFGTALAATFTIFTTSTASLGFADLTMWRAKPLTPEEVPQGYACSFFTDKEKTSGTLYVAQAYLYLARTGLVAILALITLLVRYRRKKVTLLNVIRQEGGMYYLTTVALRICDAVMKTRGVPDSYNVVYGLNRLVTPLFANRLLLNMRKIKNQETSAVVNSFMFSSITDPSERDSQMRSIATIATTSTSSRDYI